MKKLKDIDSKEFMDLSIHIDKKVLGKFQYPYPPGLVEYKDEVIQSIRYICQKGNSLRSRLEPVITIEFLPYFVILWLQDNGFEIKV